MVNNGTIEQLFDLIANDLNNPNLGACLHCPICHTENISFGKPEYKHSIDYKAWVGRGPALRIPMYCEQDHCWILRFGFHKGSTYIALEDVGHIQAMKHLNPID